MFAPSPHAIKRKSLWLSPEAFVSVGRTGFEPATPWSQTTYSTGLNYLPKHAFLLKPEKHNFLFYQGGKSKHSPLSLQIKGGITTNNLVKPVDLWYHWTSIQLKKINIFCNWMSFELKRIDFSFN